MAIYIRSFSSENAISSAETPSFSLETQLESEMVVSDEQLGILNGKPGVTNDGLHEKPRDNVKVGVSNKNHISQGIFGFV